MKKILLLAIIILSFISAKAQMTKLLDLTGSNGSNPQGNLFYDGTFLYGMTAMGGANSDGLLFKIKPDGTSYSDLLDFADVSNGKYPHGSLISDGTFLYGVTQYGGTSNAGTVFKVMPNGTGYVKLYDFDGTTNGKAPFGSLYYDGTYLYGMPQIGGSSNLGTIFKIKTDGTSYLKLLDFTGVAGAANSGEPEATLISDGTYLYALGYKGGANNEGNIFKVKTDGTMYSDILDLAGASNGSYPTNALISDGTYLYGMTESGGISNLGTIFKIKPDGSSYTKLLDFTGAANGAVPHGGLYYDGTFLYGAASGGGANNDGLLFKIMPDGSGYIDMYDFDGAAHGKAPRGDLISDGTFLYGMTVTGGTSNLGTVFKYQYGISAGLQKEEEQSKVTVYPNPSNDLVNIHGSGFENGECKFVLKNVIGQIISSDSDEIKNNAFLKTVSVSGLPDGIYFMTIETPSNNCVKKIVVQNK